MPEKTIPYRPYDASGDVRLSEEEYQALQDCNAYIFMLEQQIKTKHHDLDLAFSQFNFPTESLVLAKIDIGKELLGMRGESRRKIELRMVRDHYATEIEKTLENDPPSKQAFAKIKVLTQAKEKLWEEPEGMRLQVYKDVLWENRYTLSEVRDTLSIWFDQKLGRAGRFISKFISNSLFYKREDTQGAKFLKKTLGKNELDLTNKPEDRAEKNRPS